VCSPAARHRKAAVARLQQVSITPTVGLHTTAYPFNFNPLGASSRLRLRVVALAKDPAIRGEPRLDPTPA